MEIYDVIVVGAGPAGMSAALYTSRANLKTLVIEKECPGGKMIKAKKIDNYIGSESDPFKLASNMFSQVSKAGAKYVTGNVISIKLENKIKKVILSDGKEYNGKSVIFAIGGKVGQNNFKYDYYLNKGLSYCAICDGSFYKGKTVAVIGDNDAVENSVDYLANIADNIYFINIEDKESTRENVENFTKVTDYEIGGKDVVKYIKIGEKILDVDGVFYEVDSNNFSGFINEITTENGYIKVDENMQTNIEGIFACGDIVYKSVKQVVVAASQGAIAAINAIKYVNQNK
ncbi:MAG: FAD-dependent oxidoreductase [Bacilli bacterium]|nr:FAD-dependent oxidoreductase [Bacilli bacterium]